MKAYTELASIGANGICYRPQDKALGYMAELKDLGQEPNSSTDRYLFKKSEVEDTPIPLLCLRCRISHPLEAKIRALYRQYGQFYDLDLMELASYGLDDQGELKIRQPDGEQLPFTFKQIKCLPDFIASPFSAEVLKTYDPSLCGISHWSRIKFIARNDLKNYLRQHGLLLISDWALLNDSSSKRVKETWEAFGVGSINTKIALEIHTSYKFHYQKAKKLYREKTGKLSGWKPDKDFLLLLAPDSEPCVTMNNLKEIASALRIAVSGSWQTSNHLKNLDENKILDSSRENTDYDYSSENLIALIEQALNRAMEKQMPNVIDSQSKDKELLACLWKGWADGQTNRLLAKSCSTSVGTVSKKLKPTDHATRIAIEAAVELKRHKAFASCGLSVESAERLVNGLRNHLLTSELEGGVAPLRNWVKEYLLK